MSSTYVERASAGVLVGPDGRWTNDADLGTDAPFDEIVNNQMAGFGDLGALAYSEVDHLFSIISDQFKGKIDVLPAVEDLQNRTERDGINTAIRNMQASLPHYKSNPSALDVVYGQLLSLGQRVNDFGTKLGVDPVVLPVAASAAAGPGAAGASSAVTTATKSWVAVAGVAVVGLLLVMWLRKRK